MIDYSWLRFYANIKRVCFTALTGLNGPTHSTVEKSKDLGANLRKRMVDLHKSVISLRAIPNQLQIISSNNCIEMKVTEV